jgi:peptide/nickel transport system permease protein
MNLVVYAGRRIAMMLPLLLAALMLTFLLTRIVPGNPIDVITGPYATAAHKRALAEAAHLNRPFYVQFYYYLDGVLHGNLGTSYLTGHSVTSDLRSRFMATFELVTYAMLIAFVVGVAVGVLAAVRRGSWIDHVARGIAVLGTSMPVFWLGLILLLVFFYQLHWLPGAVGRTGSPNVSPPATITGIYTVDALLHGNLALFADTVKALVLPAFSVAFVAIAPILRMARATMIEVLDSDHVMAARALGLPARVVIWRNALKNALVPVLTITTAVYGYALGGVVLVEVVYSWPGLGHYSYDAIANNDYPAVQGFVLLTTTLYMLLYLALDLITAKIDPRTRR